MKKKEDKKTLIILLVILGLTLVGSAWWLFDSLQGPEAMDTGVEQVEYRQVFQAKEKAIANIKDFIKLDSSSNSIWEDFYENSQYQELEALEIEIDIESNVGNEQPFAQQEILELEDEGDEQ